jgi:hypothetical protein
VIARSLFSGDLRRSPSLEDESQQLVENEVRPEVGCV